MSGVYFLYTGNEHATTAFAFGDLEEISYIARRRIAEMNGKDGQITVKLLELKSAAVLGDLAERDTEYRFEPPADNVKREVTAFTGDQDTAALVLKRRLAAERSQQSATSGALSEQITPDVDPSA